MPVGRDQLNGPPPSPVTGGAGAGGAPDLGMLAGGGGPMGPPNPEAQAMEIFALGEQVTASMMAVATAAPMIGSDVAGVIEHWKTVLAKYMQQVASGATQPSPAGPQFPGGGFTSGASALPTVPAM